MMANREQHARHLPGRYRSRYVNVPQPQPNTRQNRPETTGDYCADSQRGKNLKSLQKIHFLRVAILAQTNGQVAAV